MMNESTGELEGLQLSMLSVKREKEELQVRFRLAFVRSHPPWALGSFAAITFHFWTAHGIKTDTSFARIGLKDEFRLRDCRVSEDTVNVELPIGAAYVAISFGRSELITKRFTMPARDGYRELR
jgi:hypothetical protein